MNIIRVLLMLQNVNMAPPGW